MSPVLVTCLLLPLAYLLGTFPSAVLVARARGVDITAVGSGNPGASNVSRHLGRRAGVFVFVLDALKGAVCAAVGYAAGGYAGGLALVVAAIVGHVFPITRGFRGGKGVATSGGGVMTLYPIPGAILLGVWFLVAKLTRKASLGSLAIAVGAPIALAIAGRPWPEIVTGAGIALFLIWRHAPNLARLIRGQEPSLNSGTTESNTEP